MVLLQTLMPLADRGRDTCLVNSDLGTSFKNLEWQDTVSLFSVTEVAYLEGETKNHQSIVQLVVVYYHWL
jgi:hypothetical protein